MLPSLVNLIFNLNIRKYLMFRRFWPSLWKCNFSFLPGILNIDLVKYSVYFVYINHFLIEAVVAKDDVFEKVSHLFCWMSLQDDVQISERPISVPH
jgi:hypothetical protein